MVKFNLKYRIKIDVLNKMIHSIDALKSKDDIEQIKTKVLYDIIEGFMVRYSHIILYNCFSISKT